MTLTLKLDLLLKNFNLGYHFQTRSDRAFILHMCIPCDKTFHIITIILDLDLEVWPTCEKFNLTCSLMMVAARRASLSSDNSYCEENKDSYPWGIISIDISIFQLTINLKKCNMSWVNHNNWPRNTSNFWNWRNGKWADPAGADMPRPSPPQNGTWTMSRRAYPLHPHTQCSGITYVSMMSSGKMRSVMYAMMALIGYILVSEICRLAVHILLQELSEDNTVCLLQPNFNSNCQLLWTPPCLSHENRGILSIVMEFSKNCMHTH